MKNMNMNWILGLLIVVGCGGEVAGNPLPEEVDSGVAAPESSSGEDVRPHVTVDAGHKECEEGRVTCDTVENGPYTEFTCCNGQAISLLTEQLNNGCFNIPQDQPGPKFWVFCSNECPAASTCVHVGDVIECCDGSRH